MLALTGLAACRQNSPVIVPNRVLDRPLDVVLSCVQSDGESVTVLSLDQCDGAGVGDCDRTTPQLVGFVANNERNEIGMFRQCDQNGMVDLDPETPGYNLVPVGAQPSRIVTSEDCRVVTANVGSCDLSAVDLPGLASYAVGLRPDEAPSALVTRIVPVRGDGSLLGAAPGDLIAVPRGLSLAQGAEMPTEAVGECDPAAPASVYVTFPACQLVAEIDLSSQRILQSRQFVTGDDGEISIVDAGPDPECPIECPAQFESVPDDRPDVAENGLFPGALALVEPGVGVGTDSAVTFPTLFVGGTGSDEIFEIEIENDAVSGDVLGFAEPAAIRRLELENAAGVQVIRVTPVTAIDGPVYQFLYVVAGDGSTHVVSRDLGGATLGVECDTQVDPALALSSACHPIDPDSQTSAAERRPFASGPGIRDTFGATITDWTFQVAEPELDDPSRAPFEGGTANVVGIGVTSFGRIVLAVLNQYDSRSIGDNDNEGYEPTVSSVDPLGLMNVEIRPHMLWPVIDPSQGDPTVFPLVDDAEPRRVLPAEDNPTQVLAPALRRIDLAYSTELVGDTEGEDDEEFSEEQVQRSRMFGRPANVDILGGPEGAGFYENPVVRAVVRDYRQWRGQQIWRVVWEGGVPGTESATGRIECDAPTVDPDDEDAVCHATADAPVRLVDEGATFCDEGVLAGDKLVVFGCGADEECGLGRRCLRDPSSGGATSGICVSALSYAEHFDALQQACAPFISDPCGSPRREYVITGATQTELTFAEMDIPATTFVRAQCPVPTGQDNLLDPLGPKPLPEPPADPAPLDDDHVPLLKECEARLTCALPQGEGIEAPTGGCSSDVDCDGLGGSTGAQYLCIEGVCRTPCEGGSLNCRQMVLPGPRCFAEFVRYSVTLRESFQVAVSDAANFITDQVRADPDTGECQVDPTVSTLLTSRLPLGRDEAATLELMPVCPSTEDASPSDPNPCVIGESRNVTGGHSVYHYFTYARDAPVMAVRFSNPFGTLVLDLVSLIDLATPTTAIIADESSLPEVLWPKTYARFRRARIPRNYREEFATPPQTGYQSFDDPVVVQSTPLTYPVRIVSAPELNAAYIVDAGGRGGVAGVRGQVMRITVADSQILADDQFRVR
ncbi:MAG TPA: hypothetical protein VFG69_05500 [Nannocystaceae bacterium]|nr:hypothetical protein [Nannocystaceae bacterium]